VNLSGKAFNNIAYIFFAAYVIYSFYFFTLSRKDAKAQRMFFSCYFPAGDGREKPARAKPTVYGVAGLTAGRHRYTDAMCGGALRTCNEQPHKQPYLNNIWE
jgi:hypothetical protein